MFLKKKLITTIGKGSIFNGELISKKKLKIAGEFKGKLDVKEHLYIEQDAVVQGECKMERGTINGKVEGKITANDLKVLSNGVINGNIYAASFYVKRGSKTNGSVYITGDYKK